MTHIVTSSSAMPVITQNSSKRSHKNVQRKCVKMMTVTKTAALLAGLDVLTE